MNSKINISDEKIKLLQKKHIKTTKVIDRPVVKPLMQNWLNNQDICNSDVQNHESTIGKQ